jgi:hypothetical protein
VVILLVWFPSNQAEVERRMRSAVSAEEAWKHVERLSLWDKKSGGEGEGEACRYIKETLKRYGVTVEVHQFDSLLSYPGSAQLRVLSPTVERRWINCITHAFSGTTGADGVDGELIYVEKLDDYKRLPVSGKIVLTEMIPALNLPAKVRAAQESGAIGQIHISGENYIHEMIVTPVWGTPTPESGGRIPKLPVISVGRDDGRYVKELCKSQQVSVKLKAEAWVGWKRLSLPVATISGTVEPEKYVLVAGHLDSWYLGATDNATGNAFLLELARVLQNNRALLRRSVKIAWWPGHSTGRYSGSTWYCDNFWTDLDRNCVAHLNVDSPGVKEASVYEARHMAEISELHMESIKDASGLEADSGPPGKAGDESFWGVGVPSFASRTMLPKKERAAVGGSGGGWWWHTVDDTIDKADKNVLARDLRVELTSVVRLCNSLILPMDFTLTSTQLVKILTDLQAKGMGHLDLSPLLELAQSLKAQANALEKGVARLRQKCRGMKDGDIYRRYSALLGSVNDHLMRVSRDINPVLYTVSGRFDQDPAEATSLFPGLQPISALANLNPESSEYRFLRTRLVRERNRAADALTHAQGRLREASQRVSAGLG